MKVLENKSLLKTNILYIYMYMKINMNVLSYTYNRLLYNIYYNSLFINLLLIIIYVFLFVYLADFSLCDGETEEELVAKLDADANANDDAEYEKLWEDYKQLIYEYNDLVEKCENFSELTIKTMDLPEANEIPDIIKDMKVATVHVANEMKDSLAQIREIEKNIKELDPDFESCYGKQWFE